jgi:3-hydroxybutyryl-CoA dehydratase
MEAAGHPALPELRILYFEDLAVGLSERLVKTISSSDVVGFAEITGDRNPIHLSEHFAARTPFGTRIAHGLYTAGLISAVLGTRLPGPGAIYISQTLNFRAPVKIGDTVEVIVEVAELIPERQRARLVCTCMVADEVVLDGEARWTAGTGIEVEFAPRWSAKLEYLYLDLGRTTWSWVFPNPLLGPPLAVNDEAHLTMSVVRGGVNWRF